MNLTLTRGRLASEWIKLRSLRSTYLITGLAVALGIGVGYLDLSSVAHHWNTLAPEDRAAFDPVADSFSGFQFSELAFGALGVLVVSGEYASGTIRSTLAATPQRGSSYWAKALVLAGFISTVSLVSAFAAFFIGQSALTRAGLNVGIGEPQVLRAVIGAGLYLAVVTMVGFGLGATVRHPAGGLVLMVSLVFLAWPAARAVEGFSYLPDRWLLVNAADTLVRISPLSGPPALRSPSMTMAWVELGSYLVVFLGLGAWRSTRDV